MKERKNGLKLEQGKNLIKKDSNLNQNGLNCSTKRQDHNQEVRIWEVKNIP